MCAAIARCSGGILRLVEARYLEEDLVAEGPLVARLEVVLGVVPGVEVAPVCSAVVEVE